MMQLCLPTTKKITRHVSIEELTEFMNTIDSIKERYSSFEELEGVVKAMVNRLESSLLGECLSQYDIETKVIEKEGKLYRHVLRAEKHYVTSAGEVSIKRSLYRGSDGEILCPLERQVGIVEGRWTPTAARLAYYLTAQLSPYQGEALLKEFGRFQVSKSSLDRLSRKLGQQWESQRDDFSLRLCDAIEVPEEAVSVSASFDGIMLPMKKKKEANTAQDDNAKQNKPLYKEAACAAINFYDKAGERLETLRLARMPEAKKETLKTELTQTMDSILKQRPELDLVKLADGAKDNWRYLSNELYPGEGIEILDYFHASEHLNKAIEAAYGKASTDAIAHYKKYRSVLKRDFDGANKVIRTLNYLHKKYPKRKQIEIELNYFRNNRHRMQYAKASSACLPIGSGVTEAACKTLVTQRLKCSGMRWDIPGGQGVLTARSLIQSNRFDKGWALIANSYKQSVSLPENVVLLRH